MSSLQIVCHGKDMFTMSKRFSDKSKNFERVIGGYTATNCAFFLTSAIFTIRFDFNMRMNIRYGTTSEYDVVS